MTKPKQAEAGQSEASSGTAEVQADAVSTAQACPQGDDCAGDRVPAKILDCQQGCGFRGCAACMKIHEEEPHVGDSDHMFAMFRDIGGPW